MIFRSPFALAKVTGSETRAAHQCQKFFGAPPPQEYFSFNPNADVINRVRGEVNEVKSVMVENIEKVLDRGEKIELLIDKTDQLQGDAFAFRRNTRKLKREMWWRNFRLAMGIGLGVVLLIYFVAALACGAKLNHC